MAIPFNHLASAFISPACYAWANTLDNLFGVRYKNRITFLISVSKLLQLLLLLPLIIYLGPDLMVPAPLVGILLAGAILDFIYIYPYFRALAHTDTSIVVALFSVGKVILPVLGWLFLGEQLGAWQYVGFLLVVLASLMLTFSWRRFRLNRAALYMLLSSLLSAVGSIMEKYVLMQNIKWGSVTLWMMGLGGVIGALSLLATPRQSWTLWRVASRRTKGLFLGEALLSMTGGAGSILALSLLPVSIAKALGTTQHLFIALYAWLFHRVLPGYFREGSTDMTARTKIFGLLLTLLGAVMAAGYWKP